MSWLPAHCDVGGVCLVYRAVFQSVLLITEASSF